MSGANEGPIGWNPDWLPAPSQEWYDSEEGRRWLARFDPSVPAYTPPVGDADEAHEALRPAVEEFMRQAADTADKRLAARLAGEKKLPEGEQALAAAGLAVGKTEVVLRALGHYLDAGSDTRAVSRRVTCVVQDHALGRDIARRFRTLFPNSPCQVHYGIEQPDPDAPGFADPDVPLEKKHRMCRRLQDAQEVISAGGAIGTLCGSKKRGHCLYHPERQGHPDNICGRQRQETIERGLLILAGPAALTQAPPESFKRTARAKVTKTNEDGSTTRRTCHTSADVADILVVDEPSFLSMLGGIDKPRDEPLGRLAAPLARFPGDEPTSDDADRASLVGAALTGLLTLLAELPLGPLTATTVRRIYQSAQWGVVRRAALTFKVDPENLIGPNTPRNELHETLSKLRKHNGRLFGIARLTRVIEGAFERLAGHPDTAESGWLTLVENDDGERALRMRWVEPVADAWRDSPTLLLDATPDVDVARMWFPRLTVIADAQAKTPDCVERIQVRDKVFSYLAWAPRQEEPPPDDDKAPEAKRERTAWNNVARLGRLLTVRCAQYKGQGRDGTGLSHLDFAKLGEKAG